MVHASNGQRNARLPHVPPGVAPARAASTAALVASTMAASRVAVVYIFRIAFHMGCSLGVAPPHAGGNGGVVEGTKITFQEGT